MAGPTTVIEYTPDAGPHFPKKNPNWQNVIANNVAATSAGQKPTGLQCRYRMIMDPATGREYKVVVGAISSICWTAALGAAAGDVQVADGSTIPGALYGGRIGERALIRG